MTDITIPPAALEAGARAAYEEHCRKYYPRSFIPWEEVDPEYQWEHRHEARAAFLAMLEAWPGMATYSAGMNGPYPYIILPLTEKPDDKT